MSGLSPTHSSTEAGPRTSLRIGIVVTQLHGGGAEFTVRRWTDELCARGHRVHLYTYKPPYVARPLPLGAQRTHFRGRSRASRVATFPWWLRYHAWRDDVDVLMTMEAFTNLVGLIGFRSVFPASTPLVLSERNTLTVKLRLEGGPLRLWLAQRLYQRADALAAISHPVAADVIGACGLDPDRVVVVPNPVTNTVARRVSTPAPADLHIGFVGRLVPVKRPDLFIDALCELRERGIAVRGTVVGDGPVRQEAEAYCASRGANAEFVGWQEPWWDAVGDLDCLLHPSDEEGFGNVLVEAAAAGIPCVARTSALGVADAIIPGVTGELVAGSRPSDLADGILRVVRPSHGDPREQWLEHFSVGHSVDVLLGALVPLVAQRQQR